MIINTKLGWNEGGKDGAPSHVYGYSLGFGQLELIFFFVNVRPPSSNPKPEPALVSLTLICPTLVSAVPQGTTSPRP